MKKKQSKVNEQQKNIIEESRVANFVTEPSTNAGLTIAHYSDMTKMNERALLLIGAMTQRAKAGKQETKKVIEEMLVSQAHSLDAIFNNLAQRTAQIPPTTDTQIEAIDKLLRLSLKAQTQCRTTLESLASINNGIPNVALIRQQNFAYQQQVNNGVFEPDSSNSMDSEKGKKKQKKQTNYWRLRMKQHGWTTERRLRQAALIQLWQPWKASTGPKTLEGKNRVAKNAYQHGYRSKEKVLEISRIKRLLKELL